jgi:hypothetical protein
MLAIGGALFSILVLIAPHKPKDDPDIDLSQMSEYNYGQAIALLGIMWVYAFMLLRLGFLASTFLFLMLGSLVLGERRWVAVIFASSIAIVSIWYLVSGAGSAWYLPASSACHDGKLSHDRRSTDRSFARFFVHKYRHGHRWMPDRHLHRDAARSGVDVDHRHYDHDR